MIYLFRALFVFSVFNLVILFVLDSGAGMEPVWAGIIAVCFVLSLNKAYHFLFAIGWFKGLFIMAAAVFVIIESFIIMNGLNIGGSQESDYVIVLGARVRGEVPSLTLKYRLDKAFEYLNEHKEATAILSGGQGVDEAISEAEAMRRYLAERGIESKRLILEDKSTNTYENLRNSFMIIDDAHKEARITVVTSNFHVLRGKMIAEDLGKKVNGLGSGTMKVLIPNYYLREFFAVIKQMVI